MPHMLVEITHPRLYSPPAGSKSDILISLMWNYWSFKISIFSAVSS